jgi:formylglycine-generating enzyme required for sulfatase activity
MSGTVMNARSWLWGLSLAGMTLSAAERLELIRPGSELALVVNSGQSGRAVLYESGDVRTWTPAYAFEVGEAPERIWLEPTNACCFFRVARIDCPVPTNFVWIPPGTFLMGSVSPEADRQIDEGPQRWVHIRRGFWMSRLEVTVEEYQALMGTNPSSAPSGSQRPVENMSWDEAIEYCRRRTTRDLELGAIPPACRYRLPSEAEWEYACRAGTTTRFSFGDDANNTAFTNFGWAGMNAGGVTHPVGQKPPNPWGLRDIHGNVFEWCLDFYGVYPGGQRLVFDKYHVYRGGSWYCSLPYLRSASRHPGKAVRSSLIGFRLLLGTEPDTVLPPLDVTPLEARLTWSGDGTSVRVEAVTGSEGAFVRYTTNGLEPSPYFASPVPVVTSPLTVKAIGFKDGLNQTPTLAVAIEQLPVPQVRVSAKLLEIASTVPEVTIEYTLEANAWREYLHSVVLDGAGTVKARVRKPEWLTSPVQEAVF